MARSPGAIVRWLFSSEDGVADGLLPRWLFLRGLGLIYFSAFYPLVFQIKGLIGPDGILPAGEYLQALTKLGAERFWYAPTLLWFSSGSHMLMAICWVGNGRRRHCWCSTSGRASCLSSASYVFCRSSARHRTSPAISPTECCWRRASSRSSLLRRDCGRAGSKHPPSRASLFLLQWEWFRIYFESGMVKLASGDPQWRNFTAMDEYYQNGPLPTWIGWYVQHLPHWFHAFATGATLVLELGLVWMLFLPRRWRIVCFFIVTALADSGDPHRQLHVPELPCAVAGCAAARRSLLLSAGCRSVAVQRIGIRSSPRSVPQPALQRQMALRAATTVQSIGALKLAVTSVMLIWIFYATTVEMIWILLPRFPFPTSPVVALDPFRIANRYGLFAVMTRGRYEIEYQGSNDGQNWVAYPFRYKPQDPDKATGHLRSLSAALRVEPMVRLAGHLA